MVLMSHHDSAIEKGNTTKKYPWLKSKNISIWNTVRPVFYVSEGTINNEYKLKEIKIYVVIEIKYTKLILYYSKNVIQYNASH